MKKNENQMHLLMLDALLELSENSKDESKKLLDEAGMESNLIVSNSMEKIKAFQKNLEKKNESTILNTVAERIKDLMSNAPLQTKSFLQNYFDEHAPSIQFQAKTILSRSKLTKIQAEIDLQDFAKELQKQKNSLIKKT